MPQKPLLLIGGAGVAGAQTARLLRRRHADLPLTIGGRNLDRAHQLASELGVASAVEIDLTAADLGLPHADYSGLAVFVKDETLNSMDYAGRFALPYLSLSSGAFEIGPEMAHGLIAGRTAPIVLASHWLAGALTMPALLLAERFARVDRLLAGLMIDRGEAASGPATAADFQRISHSCPSVLGRAGGHYAWSVGETAKAAYRGPDGETVDGAMAVSFDILSLGSATKAADLNVIEAFGVSSSRRQGGPAADEMVIEISGEAPTGRRLELRQTIVSPRRNGALTALSAAILLERLLGRTGSPPPGPGLYLPEHIVRPAAFVAEMRAAGVIFSEA